MLKVQLFGEESEQFKGGGVIGDHDHRLRVVEKGQETQSTQTKTAWGTLKEFVSIVLQLATLAALVGLLRR